LATSRTRFATLHTYLSRFSRRNSEKKNEAEKRKRRTIAPEDPHAALRAAKQ
jgi:hypothetical protein